MTEPFTPDAAKRSELVQRAIDAWVRKLVDFSQRNNLLYFRDLKTGTLALDDADAAQFERLLAGEAVMLGRLVPPEAREDAERRSRSMLAIWRTALSNREERGIQTLFLAHGMATWNDTRSAPRDGSTVRPVMSPVLLYPIAVERSGRDGQTFSLRLAGEAQVNLVLLLAVKEWTGLELDAEALLHVEGEEDVDPALVASRLMQAAGTLAGFHVLQRRVLGNFAFQKTALVADLRARPDVFAAHNLVAALAGSIEARASLETPPSAAVDLDALSPDDEFLVLDADSSQQQVILRALGGQNGVIQGPPGTGKSQTIVNLIASFAAQGKRVLFVAEKRAALEVVLNRLQRLGLGHLALDLHGADVSRRAVMARVAEAFEAVRESIPPADEQIHGRFEERRALLVAHDRRMHTPSAVTGMTLHDLYGQVLDLPPGMTSETRWRGPALAAAGPAQRVEIERLLTEASAIPALFVGDSAAAWSAFAFADGTAALQATDVVDRLQRRLLPAAQKGAEALASAAGLAASDDLAAWRERSAAASQWRSMAATFSDEFLQRPDIGSLEAGLRAAEAGGMGGFFARFGSGFRAAKKQVGAMRKAPASPVQLLADTRAASAAQNAWRRLGAANPPSDDAVRESTASLGAFDAALGDLRGTSRDALEFAATASGFREWLERLQQQRQDAARMPRIIELRAGLHRLGAGDFVAEMRRGQASPAAWVPLFRHAYLTSALDEAKLADSSLAGFDGRFQDEVADEFCDLDRRRLEVAAVRVRRAHAERAIAAMNRFPEQEALVRRESQKKTRHLPLRTLVSRAPDVLTALSPCWMASPLSVSQLLDIDRRSFDVVIFDEASQVLPEDAVCALVRADYAVVAGDSRQLPPTTFFAAGHDEGEVEDDDEVGGFESLLDQMMALVTEPWLLEWHYRSRDERLIAFSNHEIYGDRLVTFPGARAASPVRHVLVDTLPDENEESSSAEVQRVVGLVFEHAEQHPEQSLGVIALGIKHAQRLQDAFDDELTKRGVGSAFFAETDDERFFIKNLERVQGDERDAIILSIGYGKDASGRLPFRFGPILQQGGERRLNVAITRARSSMTVVSTFTHLDMDEERCRGRRGLELLRGYLAYAATSQANRSGAGTPPAAGVERAIADALAEQGLELKPNHGASAYRVDIAVEEPGDSEAFALAVETDGRMYHSGQTARDRDRLRPQQLERLGWRFHRIWTPDWVRQPAVETERLLAALRELDVGDESSPGATNGIQPLAARDTARTLRPRIGRRDSIDSYSSRELASMVAWVRSDGLLRTDEEMLIETVAALGFKRRGPRIDRAVRQAIAATQPRPAN